MFPFVTVIVANRYHCEMRKAKAAETAGTQSRMSKKASGDICSNVLPKSKPNATKRKPISSKIGAVMATVMKMDRDLNSRFQ